MMAEGNAAGRGTASTRRTPRTLRLLACMKPPRARSGRPGPEPVAEGGCVRPSKCPNKSGQPLAEGMEGRQPVKENMGQGTVPRADNRSRRRACKIDPLQTAL